MNIGSSLGGHVWICYRYSMLIYMKIDKMKDHWYRETLMNCNNSMLKFYTRKAKIDWYGIF